MLPLSLKPERAFRKIDLDARIEASSGEDLTLICLEEVVAALGQALHALDRQPERTPHEPIARAHGIAIWLARSVAPDNPLRSALMQFYGGLASVLAHNRVNASRPELAQAHRDFVDLLDAGKAADAR